MQALLGRSPPDNCISHTYTYRHTHTYIHSLGRRRKTLLPRGQRNLRRHRFFAIAWSMSSLMKWCHVNWQCIYVGPLYVLLNMTVVTASRLSKHTCICMYIGLSMWVHMQTYTCLLIVYSCNAVLILCNKKDKAVLRLICFYYMSKRGQQKWTVFSFNFYYFSFLCIVF